MKTLSIIVGSLLVATLCMTSVRAAELIPYGTAYTFDVCFNDYTTAADFEPTLTFEDLDITISTDGTEQVGVDMTFDWADLVTDNGKCFEFALSGTQTQAGRVSVIFDDDDDVWFPVAYHFETYGDPSAAHPVLGLPDRATLVCEVNTANYAGDASNFACILTDLAGSAVTQASGDLEGLSITVITGDQIREQRYIVEGTVWDGANSELQIPVAPALPGTLADAVTVIIR